MFGINKFSEVFQDDIHVVLGKLLVNRDRVTRGELMAWYPKEDQPEVRRFLSEYLKTEDCPYDHLRGPGGGIGYKGTERKTCVKILG